MTAGSSHTAGAWLLVPLFLWSAAPAPAQVRVSGQASSAFVKANSGASQYAVDAGRPTWAWRLDLFGDAAIADDIFFLGNVRVQQDDIFHVDLFALRFADVASTGLSIEMGEIEMPFGNLGERRYPKANPFYGLPLLREHRTPLRSSSAEFWFDDARYTRRGDGFRILDGGLYDLGAKLTGGAGIFDFAIAVVNGMVSATSSYAATTGLNTDGGIGTVARLSATPVTGLTVGGSYAAGTFLAEDLYGGPAGAYRPSDVPQAAVEGDVDFSIGHLALYGEAAYSAWRFAEEIGSDLEAAGYSLEARYTLMPRLTLAARAGGLRFNSVDINAVASEYGIVHYAGKWDRDVMRIEGAVGYRVDRAALVKLMYQWNRTFDAPSDPVDNVLVVQAVVSF